MTAKTSNRKTFTRMTPRQLARHTAEFDAEMVADEFAPPPPADRARWDKARRKPGRPRRGQGCKVISVSVERELLARTDALAKNMGLTRAGLVERGLKAMLVAEGRL